MPCGIKCTKTCTFIVLSLVLVTAGFVLSLMSWLGNDTDDRDLGSRPKAEVTHTVQRVRIIGPILLSIGMVLLIGTCLLAPLLSSTKSKPVASPEADTETAIDDHGDEKDETHREDGKQTSYQFTDSSAPNSPLILREMHMASDKNNPNVSQNCEPHVKVNITPSLIRKGTLKEAYRHVPGPRRQRPDKDNREITSRHHTSSQTILKMPIDVTVNSNLPNSDDDDSDIECL